MLDLTALQALAAVLRAGSFERAARQLHITPSAVSQRIRALEERVGGVLLVRSIPVEPTPEGARLYRHFQQIEMLEGDLRQDLVALNETEVSARSIPVALNADSLATWGIAALADFHARSQGMTLAVQLDDQDHTREWLRNGTVCGAVTTAAEPVGGCLVEPLGVMVYHAVASPALHERCFAGRPLAEALAEAPMLVFNQKDQMQHRFLADLTGRDDLHPPQQWWIPSTQAFLDATRAGLGWGLQPEPLVATELATGALVDLCPGRVVRMPLYWQSWRLDARSIHLLRDCMRRAAGAVLEAW